MSLYRKYRPQTFSHLVGQTHISKTLLNALKLNRVSHAYLFTGPRGTGKTSTARLLAKAINCLTPKDHEPCNSCEICTEIADGRLIDLIEIDAASNRGIDEIRDLREKINFAPTRAKSKVYIIDEVHMLTKEAFNALLKTLEEPPSHVYFILATTEVHKIPETILSRCQRFDFRRIEDRILIERLSYIVKEEKLDADEKALEIIAHHAEGCLRDAISLMEQLIHENKISYDHVCEILNISGIASMEKLFGFLMNSDAKSGLQEINDLFMEGYDLNYFNKRFLEFLRRALIASVEENRIADTNKLLNFIEFFQQAYDQSRNAVIPQLPLEIAVVRSCGTAPSEQRVTERQSTPVVARAEVAKVETVKPVTNIETPKQALSKQAPTVDLSLEDVQKKWDQFLNQIKSPVVKRSLQLGKLISVEGVNLKIGFSSNFEKDKLMQTENRTDMEKAFHEFFGSSIKVVPEVHKFAETVNAEAPKSDPVTDNLEKNVMDIFLN